MEAREIQDAGERADNGARWRAVGRLLAGVFLCVGAMLAPGASLALTQAEAAKVADLVEALQPDLGMFAYDETLALEWFEQDADDQGLIQAAGFTAQRWHAAVGETLRGLLAVTPKSELDAMLDGLKSGIDGLAQLSDAQKNEVKKALDEEYGRLLELREQGAAYADAVRPIAPRLKALLVGVADQE